MYCMRMITMRWLGKRVLSKVRKWTRPLVGHKYTIHGQKAMKKIQIASINTCKHKYKNITTSLN